MTKISKIQFVEKLSSILADIPYKVVIGAELEFYLKGRELDIRDLTENIRRNYPKLEKERGWNQFENIFNHRADLISLVEDIEKFKAFVKTEARKYDCIAMFEPKPFEADYGSALHLHLSLHDEFNINIFSDYEINENQYLQKTIAGILSLLEESLYLLCREDSDEYIRFDGAFMAPTNVSWGGNNRSTSIRIPDSHAKYRRVEFRVPSSNSDPIISILILLFGIISGFKVEKNIYPRIYGNAFDPQYELKSLPNNSTEAKKAFKNSLKFATYITEYFGVSSV